MSSTQKSCANLYVRDSTFDITKDRWCATCKWATLINSGLWYCPFPQGTCARIKGSIENPKPNMTDEYAMRAEYIKQQSRQRARTLEALKAVVEEKENGMDEE